MRGGSARLRVPGRRRRLAALACAGLLLGWGNAVGAQTAVPCADGEPAGAAVLIALAGDDAAFGRLVQEAPAEAFRCSGLFPSAGATLALQEAAAAAPFDAIGAADQLAKRPGGDRVIAAALKPDLLIRALENGLEGGLPFFEIRHELRKRLPPEALRPIEGRATRALAAAFAKDPAAVTAKIGVLIDDMSEDPPDDRFRIVAAFTANRLYELIARTGPQLYTSSLDGLVNILRIKLRMEKRSFLDLANGPATGGLWPGFFVSVVSGGRADALFGASDVNAREVAKVSVRLLLSPDHALDAPIIAGALADAMDAKSPAVRAALEDELAERHRTTSDPVIREIAGLAGGLHHLRLGGRPATAAFLAERFGERYPVSLPPALSGDRLFQDGVNVQRMTFYDDPDGRASFRGFVQQRRAAGWTIQEHAGFITATSPERRGRRIVIVADLPGAGEAGRAAARDWLARERLTPTVVVHRGHSYHEEATMPEIRPGTALVFWGSCGGHVRLRATLDQAPDAFVIATQNIGVSTVNQALLRIIEDRLLADGTLDWQAVWADAQARIRDRHFSAYKRPDQDATMLALRAWRAQTEQARAPCCTEATVADRRPDRPRPDGG
ncbi:hypothetical protein [Azospirillum sp. sgz302134]